MAEPPRTLSALFASGVSQRNRLATAPETSSSRYQEDLKAAIATFEQCREISEHISLFSPNETLEDISTGDLR